MLRAGAARQQEKNRPFIETLVKAAETGDERTRRLVLPHARESFRERAGRLET